MSPGRGLRVAIGVAIPGSNYKYLRFETSSRSDLGESLDQRKTKGGGENSGERKTYHKSPPQNGWTPPLMIRFPPPFVHAMSFSLEETDTDQTNPTF